MFKEQDTICLVDANNEEIVLAKKENGHWSCILCDKDENYKLKMLDHVRIFHIQVK